MLDAVIINNIAKQCDCKTLKILRLVNKKYNYLSSAWLFNISWITDERFMYIYTKQQKYKKYLDDINEKLDDDDDDELPNYVFPFIYRFKDFNKSGDDIGYKDNLRICKEFIETEYEKYNRYYINIRNVISINKPNVELNKITSHIKNIRIIFTTRYHYINNISFENVYFVNLDYTKIINFNGTKKIKCHNYPRYNNINNLNIISAHLITSLDCPINNDLRNFVNLEKVKINTSTELYLPDKIKKVTINEEINIVISFPKSVEFIKFNDTHNFPIFIPENVKYLKIPKLYKKIITFSDNSSLTYLHMPKFTDGKNLSNPPKTIKKLKMRNHPKNVILINDNLKKLHIKFCHWGHEFDLKNTNISELKYTRKENVKLKIGSLPKTIEKLIIKDFTNLVKTNDYPYIFSSEDSPYPKLYHVKIYSLNNIDYKRLLEILPNNSYCKIKRLYETINQINPNINYCVETYEFINLFSHNHEKIKHKTKNFKLSQDVIDYVENKNTKKEKKKLHKKNVYECVCECTDCESDCDDNNRFNYHNHNNICRFCKLNLYSDNYHYDDIGVNDEIITKIKEYYEEKTSNKKIKRDH